MAVEHTGMSVQAIITVAASSLPELDRRQLSEMLSSAVAGGRNPLGLKLAIGRGIIETYGGDLWVESGAGADIAIKLRLPTAAA
jgi:signal transduction histidine kinase